MGAALDWTLYPAFYGVTLWLAAFALRSGASEDVVLAAATGWTAMFVAVVERLRPQRDDWGRPAPGESGFGQDGLHFVFGFMLGALGASLLAERWGEVLWGRWLARSFAPWPDRWPWGAQIALAFGVAELTGYLQHRALHRIPLLWRFHAIHHEPRRLTVMKTTRIHFLDIGSATLLNLGALVTLGAPARVLFWLNVFTNVTALVQHGNVRWRTPRWLDAVVCTPAVHQSHHARCAVAGNMNFATNLPLWDHVFGTFLGPKSSTSVEVGLLEESSSRGFWAQIFGPFRPRAHE
jgi:ornithine lipid hydroxylase